MVQAMQPTKWSLQARVSESCTPQCQPLKQLDHELQKMKSFGILNAVSESSKSHTSSQDSITTYEPKYTTLLARVAAGSSCT